RRHIYDRRGQARGECVQQVLGRVRTGVRAEQDRGFACVDPERIAAGGVLAARGVEVLDRGPVVRPVDPAVGGAELELGKLGLCLDQIQRREHLVGVDAVADRFGDKSHAETSSVVVVWLNAGLNASSEMLCAPYFWLVRCARSPLKR